MLVSEFGPRIDRFLRMRLPRVEDAQDAYAEVWARFWTYAQETKVETVSGLIHTIARAAIAEFYKNRERHPEVFAGSDDRVVDMAVPVHLDMIAQIDVGFLKQAMQALRDEDAQLIQLRHLEGYRIKDIARQLGKTENVVSVTLNRAMNKLRKIIRDKFGEV